MVPNSREPVVLLGCGLESVRYSPQDLRVRGIEIAYDECADVVDQKPERVSFLLQERVGPAISRFRHLLDGLLQGCKLVVAATTVRGPVLIGIVRPTLSLRASGSHDGFGRNSGRPASNNVDIHGYHTQSGKLDG